MGRNKTVADRNQYVAMSNDLILTRQRLTMQQQKIILFCISKIRPQDTIDQWYTFTIKEYCDACGINISGGMYFKTIKDDLLKLCERKWGITPKGAHVTFSWIGDVKLAEYSGTVSIKFNSNFEEFLFGLNRNYTQFKLQIGLLFESTYALRIYEILRKHTTQRCIEEGYEREAQFTLEELRELLNCEKEYPRWVDFDRYILRKAKAAINSLCDDIHVEYEARKTGRSVSGVHFIISTPSALEIVMAHQAKRKRLK